jgi:hypothetical protein
MKQAFVAILLLVALAVPAVVQADSLPPPVVHGNSFEIISNSRYSSHSGFTASLSDTVMSNVLWAMSRVPSLGSSYREFYVATPSNVYLYDPATHTITVHLSGNHRYSSSSAFEIGIAVERSEEAGLAIEAGLLAGDAFWSHGSGTVTSCPMAYATSYANSNWSPNHTILMVDVFGHMNVTGLTDSCVAISSDSTLPRPATDRPDTFEVLTGELHQDSVFDQTGLPLQTLSQLLWAGYGVTPHMPIGKRGTTIPSAVAYYYLTRHIYLVSDTAVFRYNNRVPPGTDLTTSDHRLEHVTSGDRRDSLRTACPRVPSTAPTYIVVCVGDTTTNWTILEAGFAGYQYLMEAEALGLGGFLTAPLSVSERTAVRTALGLPSSDYPVIIFSTGQALTGVKGPTYSLSAQLRVRSNCGLPVRLEYVLSQAGSVRFSIRDLAGRTLRNWTETRVAPGRYVAEWPGTDNTGAPVPSGVYLVQMAVGNEVSRARVTVTR